MEKYIKFLNIPDLQSKLEHIKSFQKFTENFKITRTAKEFKTIL